MMVQPMFAVVVCMSMQTDAAASEPFGPISAGMKSASMAIAMLPFSNEATCARTASAARVWAWSARRGASLPRYW